MPMNIIFPPTQTRPSNHNPFQTEPRFSPEAKYQVFPVSQPASQTKTNTPALIVIFYMDYKKQSTRSS